MPFLFHLLEWQGASPAMRAAWRWLGWGLAGLLVAGAGAATAEAQRFEPLPPEQAFVFSAAVAAAADGGEEVVVEYRMPEGLYLYQKRFLLSVAAPAGGAAAVQLGEVRFPAAQMHEDPFFGTTPVYYGGVTLRAAVRGAGAFELLARSQGCDEQVGICYPPYDNIALLTAGGGGGGGAGAAAARRAQEGDYARDEAGYLSRGIANNSIWWTMGVFFILGVGLSFTPCVLPMLPILLGVIGGGKTRRRIATLTAFYIAGVALTFSALGVAAALSGQLLSAALQTPWALATVAGLFVVLALSLLGAFELRAPAFVARHLAGAGDGGSSGGAFVMGAVAAVAASACVAAPLIGALLYIGASGNVALGALALLSLALGMCLLLAVAGLAGAQTLPRAGAWTLTIKRLFGVLLLGAAVWVASPIVPAPVQLLLYGVLALFAAALLASAVGGRGNGGQEGIGAPLCRALALAAALWGAALLAGAAAGGRDALLPLSPFVAGNAVYESGEGAAQAGAAAGEGFAWRSVGSLDELQATVASAGRPVMLEFYADWCVSCKEFERFTLSDARVRQQLANTLPLRADVTRNSAQDKELLAHFNLFGPPAILFYDAAGGLIPDVRVIGYENADEFLQTLGTLNSYQ